MAKAKNPTDIPADDVDLTLHSKGDLAHLLSTDGHTEPAMRGFAPKFHDIVDYIVKITHEIWEERGIGRLYDYYGTNMRIHTSNGEIYSREKVIEATIQSLAAFPNRRLYADEVIWAGDDEKGYFSSHRLTHEGHNWGHSSYGPPTGRRVSYRAIADCAVVEGVIVEEWLVRDELSLVYQLGFDVHEMARQMAQQETDIGQQFTVPAEPDRLRGQLPPEAAPADSEAFDVGQFVKRAIHEVWNWRLLNKVGDYYIPQFICESASGRRLYGRNQYRNYILSLLSPFPDAAVSVDHFCALRDGPNRYRTATRWTMTGTHTGPGIYGTPTGKQIRIMGISHHLVENGKFIQEWTLFDEFALLKQLYKPT
ncbi:ester cyclase [Candidatus Leptofilum sp.]|uniref:ester cyclase n=1 Tax=Candidatus Leptofilum sp. TaxID=3241576 RepID=UPI003B5BD5B2